MPGWMQHQIVIGEAMWVPKLTHQRVERYQSGNWLFYGVSNCLLLFFISLSWLWDMFWWLVPCSWFPFLPLIASKPAARPWGNSLSLPCISLLICKADKLITLHFLRVCWSLLNSSECCKREVITKMTVLIWHGGNMKGPHSAPCKSLELCYLL